jgi:hypothetical protein
LEDLKEAPRWHVLQGESEPSLAASVVGAVPFRLTEWARKAGGVRHRRIDRRPGKARVALWVTDRAANQGPLCGLSVPSCTRQLNRRPRAKW